MLSMLVDFSHSDFLLGPGKGIVFGEEEHAVAFLTLPHRDAGAVPVGGRDFRGFIFVVAAGA